jgi:hypothetical protein
LKRDLLSSRLLPKLRLKFGRAGGEAALIKYVHEAHLRWAAETTCKPAYVVQGCKEYRSTQAIGTSGATPSAAVLIEEITGHR